MNGLTELINPAGWLKNREAVPKIISFVLITVNTDNPETTKRAFREKIAPIKWLLPFPANIAAFLALIAPAKFLTVASKTVVSMAAKTFIAANSAGETLKVVKKLGSKNISSNLDILGEAVLSEEEAEKYQDSYALLTDILSDQVNSGQISISLKASSFYSQAHPASPEQSAFKISSRIELIIAGLAKSGGHAYLDAEEYEHHEINFLVFKNLYQKFGNTIRFVLQAYLKKSGSILNRLADLNNPESPVWVRLVRGAYWDYECYRAKILGWSEPPVFTKKEQTDENFIRIFIEGIRRGLVVVPATHNADSIVAAETIACTMSRENLVPIERYLPEFQALFGIGNKIADNLARKKVPVRLYLPIILRREATLPEAMAYLLRRLNESQVSFITQSPRSKTTKKLAQIEKWR